MVYRPVEELVEKKIEMEERLRSAISSYGDMQLTAYEEKIFEYDRRMNSARTVAVHLKLSEFEVKRRQKIISKKLYLQALIQGGMY